MGFGVQLMPMGGGYCQQPALAMDAFEMFDRWFAESKKAGSQEQDG